MFEWVTQLVETSGYLGVALLMFLENVFPPIPSELIMPLAGYTSANGNLQIVGTVAAGTVGSVAGALLWYYIGHWIGLDRLKSWASRHGRWLTLTPQEIDRANDWFGRHGGSAVFFGRLVPAVRTLISVPAGFARMSMLPFLLYSTAGTVLWTSFLAGAGYLLGSRYGQIADWMNPVSNVIVGALVVWYLYRVWSFDPQDGKAASDRDEAPGEAR